MTRSTALPLKARVPADATPSPAVYRLFRRPVRAILERRFGFSVEGLEHLPPAGPYLVAANHHNYLDGVVLAVALPEPIMFLVMPRVWRATPLHPLFHRHIGSIRLNLDRPDVGALRRALDALERGRIVGIFPEGPFSVKGQLESGLPGVGLLALKSGVPVIPAAIQGTFEALAERRFYIPRRHPLRVKFGPPRHFVVDEAEGRTQRARVTEQVMADIATLLR